jgi:hypothetical protein
MDFGIIVHRCHFGQRLGKIELRIDNLFLPASPFTRILLDWLFFRR